MDMNNEKMNRRFGDDLEHRCGAVKILTRAVQKWADKNFISYKQAALFVGVWGTFLTYFPIILAVDAVESSKRAKFENALDEKAAVYGDVNSDGTISSAERGHSLGQFLRDNNLTMTGPDDSLLSEHDRFRMTRYHHFYDPEGNEVKLTSLRDRMDSWQP